MEQIHTMSRLEALLLCDLAVVGPDRKLQLQGIFDTVIVGGFPAQHQRAWIYFRFYPEMNRPDGGNHQLRLQLLRPSGIRESMPELRVEPDINGKVEGFVEMRGMPLLEEGQHRFELYFDDEEIGYCQFEAKRASAPEQTGGKSNATIQ
jgi:hypothetical protein